MTGFGYMGPNAASRPRLTTANTQLTKEGTMAKNFKSPQDFCRRAARKAKRVAQRAGRRLTGRKMLTVVIPLYNAMPYFKKTVASILEQTYDLGEVEVLVMDDGSTDGSLEYAKEVAAQHPKLFRVVECGRTGGPSVPRNMGIEQAKGKYIFFCDADDYFGEDAFRRMVRHAEEWKPDVMLVKLATPDGRPIAKAPFRKGDIPRADIYSDPVCDSLTCYKLFRTKPLKGNGIRFDPGLTLREDDLFVEEAVLRTGRHSIAADYSYYYVTTRDDGSNLIALSPCDFERDLKVFSRLTALLERYADMGKVLCGDRIMQRVFRYSWMGAAKAIGLCKDVEERQANFERLKDASGPYLNAEGVKYLPSSMRLLIKAMQLNDESYFSELAAAIGVTQEYGFERYDVLEEDVREEDGRTFWHPTFAGHQLEIEVNPAKVMRVQ